MLLLGRSSGYSFRSFVFDWVFFRFWWYFVPLHRRMKLLYFRVRYSPRSPLNTRSPLDFRLPAIPRLWLLLWVVLRVLTLFRYLFDFLCSFSHMLIRDRTLVLITALKCLLSDQVQCFFCSLIYAFFHFSS